MNNVPLPGYLEPQWFFPLFIIMWFGVSGMLAHIGGWSSLAARFRATHPPTGKRFGFASGSMGSKLFPVRYGGCLFVTVGDTGIHLAILFPFRFQSPPLLIPWSQIESVTERNSLFMRDTIIRVRGQETAISVYGRAGVFIRETYARTAFQKGL